MHTPRTRRLTLAGRSLTAQDDGRTVRVQGIQYGIAQRGAPPEPVKAWSQQQPLRVACPQPDDGYLSAMLGVDQLEGLSQQEECLRVSVTAPTTRGPDELLPVMVWIHGGGYRGGAGDASIHDPTLLVRDERVVFVAISYRLGAFGFLRGAAGAPANLGLMDVLLGLEWVQANISAFGGDPDKVTLFGQSSGADLISKLMTLPRTRHLTKRIILQSAPLGISMGREGLTDRLAELGATLSQDAQPEEVLALYPEVDRVAAEYRGIGQMPFTAEYGQPPLPAEESVAEALRANASHFDALIGYTTEETRFFLPALLATSRVARLPVVGRLANTLLMRRMNRDIYVDGAERLARALAKAGASVQLYQLRWSKGVPPIGAGHTTDLGLLFPKNEREAQQPTGRRLRAIWGEFARSGRVADASATDQLISIRTISSLT